MNTESNTEGIIKTERRKVFQVMNSLPWILLFLVIGFIAIYFYIQNQKLQKLQTLNKLNVEEVEEVAISKSFIGPIIITNIITNTIERFFIITNTITITKTITNIFEKVMEKTNTIYLTEGEIETKLRTEIEKEYNRYKEIERKRFDIEIEIERVRSKEEATKKIQIEAILKGFANWGITVEGDRSFVWVTNNVIMSKDIHGMSMEHGREYPFTVDDLQLAREIKLDIEKELKNSILLIIETNFIGKVNFTELELKKKLEMDIGIVIKNLFDGFETYQKEKRKWLWTK